MNKASRFLNFSLNSRFVLFFIESTNSLVRASAEIKQTFFDGSFSSGFGLNETDFHILTAGCLVFFLVSLVSERGVDVRAWIRRQGFVVKLLVPLFLVYMTMMFAVTNNALVGGFLYAQF